MDLKSIQTESLCKRIQLLKSILSVNYFDNAIYAYLFINELETHLSMILTFVLIVCNPRMPSVAPPRYGFAPNGWKKIKENWKIIVFNKLVQGQKRTETSLLLQRGSRQSWRPKNF